MAAIFPVALSARFSSELCVIGRRLCGRFSSSPTETSPPPAPPKIRAKMDALQKNPYLTKYADKITALQKRAPEEFKVRLEQVSKPRRTTEELCASSSELMAVTKAANERLPRGDHVVGTSHLRQRKLDDVVKLDLIRDKSPEEISKIWLEHHQKLDKIAAVIPAQIYSTIFERSQRFPTFVYPVPRRQGFEFVMAQFSLHECHFTLLINFQAHKENAAVCATVVHFPELEAEKGIVLMQGEYDKNVLNGTEARCLANQLQFYYNSKPDSDRWKLLEAFNLNPSEFQHEELVRQLHSLQF